MGMTETIRVNECIVNPKATEHPVQLLDGAGFRRMTFVNG